MLQNYMTRQRSLDEGEAQESKPTSLINVEGTGAAAEPTNVQVTETKERLRHDTVSAVDELLEDVQRASTQRSRTDFSPPSKPTPTPRRRRRTSREA